MNDKIYVVMGSTGEYSDRNEWTVVAYKDEQLAIKHVELASSLAREWFIKYKEDKPRRYSNIMEFDTLMKEAFKYLDPDISMYYSGTFYWYDEVDVLESVPGES